MGRGGKLAINVCWVSKINGWMKPRNFALFYLKKNVFWVPTCQFLSQFIESKQIDTAFPTVSWGTVASLPHNSFMTNSCWAQFWVQHFNNKRNELWPEEKNLNGWGSVGQVTWEMNGEESTGWHRGAGLTLPKGQKHNSSVIFWGWNIQARIRKQFNKLRCQNQNFPS